jgi:hypothetical protein
MLNIYNLNFEYVAIHVISPKAEGGASAHAVINRNIINLSEEVTDLIKERLSDALGKPQKTFELAIEDKLSTSFFGLCEELKDAGKLQFMDNSIRLANRLAESQIAENIPGGYFVFIKAKDMNGQRNAYIALKADISVALSLEMDRIKILNNLFLTKSTKFYKFGLLYERLDSDYLDHYVELEYPNDKYCAVLFDEQFRADSIPAEYFYKEFLGLSIQYNPKIQSKRFFDFTERFIKQNVEHYDEMNEMMHVLKNEVQDNTDLKLQPADFAQKYFQNPNHSEVYTKEILPLLPEEIQKDHTLIKSKLKSIRIEFPNKITISGNEDSMSSNFMIITNIDELKDLNPKQESYTIIKIKGKPFKS